MAATVLRGRHSLETATVYVLVACCVCLSVSQPTVRQVRFTGDGCFGRIKWPHHPFRRFHREWKNLVESVLVEVKRQTNENYELRQEVAELRNTSAQYRQLLMDMASNVDRLVKTLVDKDHQQQQKHKQKQHQQQQQQQCSCDVNVDKSEFEPMASVTLNPGFAPDEDGGKKKSSSRYFNRIVEDNSILASNYGSGGHGLRKSKVESAKSPTTDTYNDGPITREFLINGSYPRDCDDIFLNGRDKNGIYSIKPNFAAEPFHVECEFKDGKAWTLIQKRTNGVVNFYRNWDDYKEGFGNIGSEYWLGNEKIYYLSVQATYELKINMWDWSGVPHGPSQQTGNYFEGGSSFFYIEDEKNFYKLRVPEDFYAYQKEGPGSSGLRLHIGPFTTFDRQSSQLQENCATKFHCGWWFRTCVRNSNLNGRYYQGGYKFPRNKTRSQDDIYWYSVGQSLRRCIMKIHRVSNATAKMSKLHP